MGYSIYLKQIEESPIILESLPVGYNITDFIKDKILEKIDNVGNIIIVNGVNSVEAPLISTNEDKHKVKITKVRIKESKKNYDTLFDIIAQFNELGVRRNDIIVAIGGGTTTDLVGFAAAIYQRGIRWVAIPTTFMSMVDAAIGGKTAINFGDYKNYVGTTHLPEFIFYNLEYLKTNSFDMICDGMAEVIKVALIGNNKKLLENIELIYEDFSSGNFNNKEVLIEVIKETFNTKMSIVKNDMYDYNTRKLLNFGHTFGHALESYINSKLKYSSNYGSGIQKPTIGHGACVYIGMLAELYLGKFEHKDFNKIKELLRKYGTFYVIKEFQQVFSSIYNIDTHSDLSNISEEIEITIEELLRYIQGDKKNTSELISFVNINNMYSEYSQSFSFKEYSLKDDYNRMVEALNNSFNFYFGRM
jgi:3-dehydroquinate synthetase